MPRISHYYYWKCDFYFGIKTLSSTIPQGSDEGRLLINLFIRSLEIYNCRDTPPTTPTRWHDQPMNLILAFLEQVHISWLSSSSSSSGYSVSSIGDKVLTSLLSQHSLLWGVPCLYKYGGIRWSFAANQLGTIKKYTHHLVHLPDWPLRTTYYIMVYMQYKQTWSRNEHSSFCIGLAATCISINR